MKPQQILRLEIHLGFKFTETKKPKDIFDWQKSRKRRKTSKMVEDLFDG